MVSDDILTTQEAAAILGAHIETIRRLARRGGIPAFKIGKDWRYSRAALEKWATDQQLQLQRPAQPKVLIVDDDAATVKLMGKIIASIGCRVITAQTGRAGLETTADRSVDLVLLDLNMPEMDGATFIARFRGQHEETPVIIVTGCPDSELITAAMDFGPLMLLKKPLNKGALIAAVKLALKGRLADKEPAASASL
jgi:excisionase family DNA binding protein